MRMSRPSISGRFKLPISYSRISVRLLPDQPNGPEVGRQTGLKQVRIGEGEVALHAPFRAPRVPGDKPLVRVVVTHRHHRVPAHRPLTPPRHRRMSRARDGLALEALIHRESEDERIA